MGGSLTDPAPVRLYLLTPEKLELAFVDSPPGPQTLVLDKFEIPFAALAPGRTGTVQHTNLCDPYTVDPGKPKNPYSCGAGGEDDCYDLTLISSYVRLSNEVNGDQTPAKLDRWDRLMGTPLHIRVSQPKTTAARIEAVTYGESSYSPKRTGILFETITPADGRIMIARRAFMPLVWQNTDTLKTHVGSYDIVYGVSPENAEPCDVNYWGDLYPITHAPYDDRVNSRYLFAQQPFRDPGGHVIPDGVDIKGTYPWMDKEAKMFSMQISPAKLFPTYSYDKGFKSRYPVRCVSETQCSYDNLNDTDNSKDNLYMLIGAWTQGKMVLLDGLLNDIDFRLGGLDKDHSYLSLYQPGTGLNPSNNGEVRVGSTRGDAIPYPVSNADGDLIGHYKPENFSMFDSIENRLNYLGNLKPAAFNDVVWNMSSGHSTVELAFDDYLNPDGFIVSNMVAHLQHQNYDWYRMSYFDGWHQLSRSFNGQVRIQNSATALPERWQIPSYGRVYHGRLEPVANGGIRGKGLWFDGRRTRIEYQVPEQPQDITQSDWFYSLFIDPRFENDTKERLLIQFPDKSRLTLSGLTTLKLFNSNNTEITSVQLPQQLTPTSWTHIAFLATADTEKATRGLQLFVDGFPLHSWTGSSFDSAIESSNFRPAVGKLRIGDEKTARVKAFKGWIDEFKVFAYKPNLESVCNFAHGTLIGLTNTDNKLWSAVANRYDASNHQLISDELSKYGQTTHQQYTCYHNYSGDQLAHLYNIPNDMVSLRDAFNFPEGPLYHDAPRPDSSNNAFCNSCHQPQGIGGLGLDALTLKRDTHAKYDVRRQPTQPPVKVYGNIPADWLEGSPAENTTTGYQGQYIDEWILPSSHDVSPKVNNLVLANNEGEPWYALNHNQPIHLESLPNNVSQLRANVNGLVRQVRFEINGINVVDDQAPFTVDINYLIEGLNQIVVSAMLENGEISEPYSVEIELIR